MDKELKIKEQETNVPGLLIPRSFLDQISEETLKQLGTREETGGYIYGLRTSTENTPDVLVPIGCFTPNGVDRSFGHFSVGGPECTEFDNWQRVNWDRRFKDYMDTFNFNYERDMPSGRLKILGIWHRHPGSYIDFSTTDDRQVNEHLTKMEDYLFPIVVIKDTRSIPLANNQVRIYDDGKVAIDSIFYFRRRGSDKTLKLQPTIAASEYFPSIEPVIPWFVKDYGLYKRELEDFGEWNAKVKPVLAVPEKWFVINIDNLKSPIVVRTSNNYSQDGTVELILGNPKDPKTQKIGLIIPIDKGITIAQAIEPLVRYYLANQGI